MKKIIISCFIATIAIISINYMSKNENEIQLVEVVNVVETNVFNSVIASGYIEESYKEYVSIDKNGTVEKVNFNIGDKVKKGDEILTISVKDILGEITKDNIVNLLNVEESVIFDTKNQEKIKIISNIDGIITKIPTNIGETIVSGIPFLTISNSNDLVAKISIPERYYNQIKVGQSARINGVSFGGEIIGEVTQIMPYAKTSFDIMGGSGSVTVDAVIDINTLGKNILPGCSIEAKIIVDKRENALVVPYQAIYQIGKMEYVNIFNDGIVQAKEIITGYELDSGIEVMYGIDKNDIIITTNNLENGQKVRYE